MNFKGTRDGLILEVNDSLSFDEILHLLEDKSKESNTLLKGADIVGIKGKSFSYKEKAHIEELLEKKFEISVLSLENFTYNKINQTIKEQQCEKAKFVNKTLRSGEEVVYEGDVIILGDVNPGAIVKAGGNIVVIGKLRGIAHAGYNENNDAFIIANKLCPNQLRISTIISRAPDNIVREEKVTPEIAFIDKDRIMIEKI